MSCKTKGGRANHKTLITAVNRIILAAPPPEGRQYGLPLVSVPPLTVPVPVGVGVGVGAGVRNDIYFKISPRVLNLGLSY